MTDPSSATPAPLQPALLIPHAGVQVAGCAPQDDRHPHLPSGNPPLAAAGNELAADRQLHAARQRKLAPAGAHAFHLHEEPGAVVGRQRVAQQPPSDDDRLRGVGTACTLLVPNGERSPRRRPRRLRAKQYSGYREAKRGGNDEPPSRRPRERRQAGAQGQQPDRGYRPTPPVRAHASRRPCR